MGSVNSEVGGTGVQIVRQRMTMNMLLLVGNICILVSLSQAKPQFCVGCPEEVTALSEKQQNLVDWAVVQLQGTGGVCRKNMVSVENFTSQVVAGTLSKFDLVLNHESSNPEHCGSPNSGTERCTLTVWEQSWRNFREIQWEDTSCIRAQ